MPKCDINKVALSFPEEYQETRVFFCFQGAVHSTL